MLNPRLQNAINKIIVKKYDEFRDYIEVIDYIKELLQLSYTEVIEGVFTYIMNQDENPFDEVDIELDYYVGNDDMFSILTNIGWFDKYLTDNKAFYTDFPDIIKTGDRIYMFCSEWKDLSNLFESSDVSLVEDILDSDTFELFDHVSVNFEDDVTEVLSDKAINHIKEYIKENDFIGKEIYTLDDEYGDILTEELIEDKHTLFHLIDEEQMFNDLKWELVNMYRWAYNSASESELFKDIKETISSFLGSEGDWDEIRKGEKIDHILKFDVTNIFYLYLKLYVESIGKFPGDNENYFLEVLENVLVEQDEELSAPNVDNFYPDNRMVEEDMTENVISNL
jgi:site-specific DNA-adenine methylase